MILDNKEMIAEIDTSNLIHTLINFPQQIKQALTIIDQVSLPKMYNIHNIIISGVGESVTSGEILQSYLQTRLPLPIIVNKSSDLPGWVRKNTLIFFQSYSGDTEETLHAFRKAVEKKAAIIGISSGGKLEKYCTARSIPHILIPKEFYPRTAVPFFLIYSLIALEKIGIVTLDQRSIIQDIIDFSKQTISHVDISSPLEHNIAKQIAQTICGTIPQIYSWGIYAPIGRRWGTQFNENSKVLSKYNTIPECTHNDMIGWTDNSEISKFFSCIFFRDKKCEHQLIQKRIKFMKKFLQSEVSNIIEIPVMGKQDLAKMIYLWLIGDFTSYYLAILRGVDPSPIHIIDAFEEELCLQ